MFFGTVSFCEWECNGFGASMLQRICVTLVCMWVGFAQYLRFAGAGCTGVLPIARRLFCKAVLFFYRGFDAPGVDLLGTI